MPVAVIARTYLKSVKFHQHLSHDKTLVGRLFERVITQEAQVILEIHYSPAQAKEDKDNPEETLRQELQPSFEALKERLLGAVDGGPPRCAWNS